MANSIIGYHYSEGGNKSGLGAWLTAANQKGIPVGLKGVDSYGVLWEATNTGNQYNVANHLIYRASAAKIGREVPNYTINPVTDAQALAAQFIVTRPPEFDAAKVIVELINEPRGKWTAEPVYNDMHPADYLGEWCLAAAVYLNGKGFRFCGPSFNAGEPGDDGQPLSDAVKQYSTPGMLKYLSYCAANPHMAALAVHDYIWNFPPPQYPQLWGRWEAAIAAADLAGIPRTFPIYVTEFGFSPSWAPTMPEVEGLLDFYNGLAARFPQVKMAAAWTLQGGYEPVDQQVNTWMQYPIDRIFTAGPQPAKTHAAFGATLPNEEPPMDTWQEELWKIAKQKQLVAFNPKAALQKMMIGHGFSVAETEFDYTRPDGVKLKAQLGIHPVSAERRVYYAVVPNWGDVKWFGDPAVLPPDNPFDGLEIGAPFRLPFALTSPFNAPRDYGNKKHEGADYDIWGQPADSKEPVLCGYDGIVYRSENNGTAYGHFVVTKHENNGFPFYLWYCHMDSRVVVPGQVVKRGDPVGELGGTGGNWGEHIHLNLQVPGFGLAGYVVPDVVDPAPFVSMVPVDDPPPPTGVDMRHFMIADKTAWRVVRMPDGRQEDIQDMDLGGGMFVRRKNDLAEWWKVDASFFYLVHDTSPDKGNEGIDRVYTLTKNNQPGAPKNPVMMDVGQEWWESGNHFVQFRAKSDCLPLTENSGGAGNTAVLVSHKTNYTFNAYGQNLTLDEVIFLKTGAEEQIYGRHGGKAVGWCGWKAPWGSSEIVELYWNRPPMVTEPNRYCSW